MKEDDLAEAEAEARSAVADWGEPIGVLSLHVLVGRALGPY